jgi:hypothetical protein
MRGRRVAGLASFVFLLAGAAGVASAQDSSPWNLGVAAVGVQYDLVGTGNAPGIALRATRDLTTHVVLETRSLFAWPGQQSGASTLFVPEAQLQYRWNVARLSPYVGGGAGLAMTKSHVRTDWDPTFSLSAGSGIRLTERFGLVGELRIRGIERRFAASTAEWSVGAAWQLPSL